MKVAILGVWHVHTYLYVREAIKRAEVVGFFERDDAVAEKFNAEFGLRRFGTREELLESGAEGVIICSSTLDHPDDVIAAAQAEKQIFCEKVFAITDSEALRAAEAVKKSGVPFVVNFPNKYTANYASVIKTARSGELGKINFVRVRFSHSASSEDWLPAHFLDKEKCGGGAMIDHGAHGFYLVEELLGTPRTAVSARTVSSGNPGNLAKNTDRVEDNAAALLTYEDGAIAVIEASSVSKGSPATFEVYGENGWAKVYNDDYIKCCPSPDGESVIFTSEKGSPSPIRQFLLGDILPGCSIDDACAVTHMINMAYGRV